MHCGVVQQLALPAASTAQDPALNVAEFTICQWLKVAEVEGLAQLYSNSGQCSVLYNRVCVALPCMQYCEIAAMVDRLPQAGSVSSAGTATAEHVMSLLG